MTFLSGDELPLRPVCSTVSAISSGVWPPRRHAKGHKFQRLPPGVLCEPCWVSSFDCISLEVRSYISLHSALSAARSSKRRGVSARFYEHARMRTLSVRHPILWKLSVPLCSMLEPIKSSFEPDGSVVVIRHWHVLVTGGRRQGDIVSTATGVSCARPDGRAPHPLRLPAPVAAGVRRAKSHRQFEGHRLLSRPSSFLSPRLCIPSA
jgi:hypothetical protein